MSNDQTLDAYKARFGRIAPPPPGYKPPARPVPGKIEAQVPKTPRPPSGRGIHLAPLLRGIKCYRAK